MVVFRYINPCWEREPTLLAFGLTYTVHLNIWQTLLKYLKRLTKVIGRLALKIELLGHRNLLRPSGSDIWGCNFNPICSSTHFGWLFLYSKCDLNFPGKTLKFAMTEWRSQQDLVFPAITLGGLIAPSVSRANTGCRNKVSTNLLFKFCFSDLLSVGRMILRRRVASPGRHIYI